MTQETDDKHEELKEFNREYADLYDPNESYYSDSVGGGLKPTITRRGFKVLTDEEIARQNAIRDTGINYNEKMMVDLWNQYHFIDQQKFKFLYYDSKE